MKYEFNISAVFCLYEERLLWFYFGAGYKKVFNSTVEEEVHMFVSLLTVTMSPPPGSAPMSGTTLTRACGRGGTSWRTSTRWGTVCGSRWAASCSRAQRSCPGPCPPAASAESGSFCLINIKLFTPLIGTLLVFYYILKCLSRFL